MTPYRLPLGRILALACVLVGAGLSEAAAQFPPPPGQTAPAQAAPGSVFPPPPGQRQQDSAFPSPPGQGSAPTSITVGPSGGGFGPPARKASREEVCPIFKSFAVKEAKMVTFLETNQKLCGVPPNIITQMKTNHAATIRIRTAVCSAAPAGPSAAPTLSDALGGPIIADDQSAKLPGRGTFDTLTGNALQK